MAFQVLGAGVLILLGLAGLLPALRSKGPQRQKTISTNLAKVALGLAWLSWTWLLVTGRIG